MSTQSIEASLANAADLITAAPLQPQGDMAVLCQQILAALQEGSADLPMLPRVAGEVIAVASSDDMDAGRLAALIQQDPSLAAEVLRVANTPAFRGAGEIVSLQQAIARMGMDRVRDVALAASLRSELFNATSYSDRLDDFWRTAVATSCWSRELARACRQNVEMAYLSALLHEIGIPVLLTQLESRLAGPLPPMELEQVIWHLAPSAGVTLIESWNLPAGVIGAVSSWRQPPPTDRLAQLTNAARTVDGWVQELGDAEFDSVFEDLALPPAFAALNLYPEDVETLFAQKERVQALVEVMVG